MKLLKTFGVCALLLMTSALRAQPVEDLTLVDNTPVAVSAPTAVSATVDLDMSTTVNTMPLAGLTFSAGSATLTKEQVHALIEAAKPAGFQSATLALLNSTGTRVKLYRLAIPGAGSVAGSTASSDRKDLADIDDCATAASQWKSTSDDWKASKNSALVLFTPSGQYCPDKTARVVRQGDDVFVGIVKKEDDKIDNVNVKFEPCDAEDAEPNLYISSKRPAQFVGQSGTGIPVLSIYDVRRCYNASTKITAEIKSGTQTINAERSLNLYPRYRGTLQMGALYTDLHEQSFALRDEAGQQVIYNKEAEKNGPEYVASVLVYGFPRYITKGGWKTGYRGRDILHDFEPMDRLGLIFTAGLKDPGDRFGTGFAFEVAYGINIFWVKHWFRQRELVGVNLGDPFTGAVETLPTRREWQSDSSFGISFDLRYLTALFDRK